MRNSTIHFIRPLALALAAIVAGGGCEAQDAGAEPLGVDLARFGVDQVIAAGPDSSYLLLDADGKDIGRVAHEVDGDAVALDVEFDGAHSRFTWSDDGASLQCADGPRLVAGPGLPAVEGDVMAGCRDAFDVAALVAVADGVEVPGFTAAPEVDFRMACETISTGGDNCAACRNNAYAQSAYSEYNGGSCTQGWFSASCTHTYCSGGSEQQLAMEAH